MFIFSSLSGCIPASWRTSRPKAEPTSDQPKPENLCERCSLLSFDDGAIGGQEVVGEDGVARLCFPESRIECRPLGWLEHRDVYPDGPKYRLIRLDWELDETLPDMAHLSRSSQLGCTFCQALRGSLVKTITKEPTIWPIEEYALNLVAYLSLVEGGMEGLVIEGTFKHTSLNVTKVYQTIFPVEATPGKLFNLTESWNVWTD